MVFTKAFTCRKKQQNKKVVSYLCWALVIIALFLPSEMSSVDAGISVEMYRGALQQCGGMETLFCSDIPKINFCGLIIPE